MQNMKVPLKLAVHWGDMEARATISTHKHKAFALEEESDTIIAGWTPPQPVLLILHWLGLTRTSDLETCIMMAGHSTPSVCWQLDRS